MKVALIGVGRGRECEDVVAGAREAGASTISWRLRRPKFEPRYIYFLTQIEALHYTCCKDTVFEDRDSSYSRNGAVRQTYEDAQIESRG